MSATHYSAHFSKREMLASETAARKGFDQTPSPEVEDNLRRLCIFVLEPLRDALGPLHISSGYRCPELNVAIGGSATSAHPDGRAADFAPLGPATLRDVVEYVVRSDLPFDQVIYEFGRWVHIGIARTGKKPRREALMIFKGHKYEPWNPADPRTRE